MADKNTENTAALEQAYNEISLAVRGSMEQPPPELLNNVMEKIKAGDVQIDDSYQAGDTDEQAVVAKPLRIEVKRTAIDEKPSLQLRMLTRYMPIAACLVVALLVWGYWSIFNPSQHDASPETQPSLAMPDSGAVPAPAAAPVDAAGDAIAPSDTAADAMQEENRLDEGKITFEVDSGSGYVKISASEALLFMSRAEQYVILDVRTEQEHNEIRIKDSILIPHDEISTSAYSVIPDTDQIIFVYCRSGVRSAIAAGTLAEMGYTHVYDIGGITGWPYETE